MHESTPPSSLPQSRHRDIKYRSSRSLPVPLLDSCSIWIEEQLYSQAFSLLTDSLTPGAGTPLSAFTPPPQHLALAATLSAHPRFTTRTTSQDKHAAADDALKYLRSVNGLVGAANAGLDRAFRFAEADNINRGKRARPKGSDLDVELDEQPGQLTSPYIGKESLWTNADDFWSVVGWAFNCSVVQSHRWERWKLWLDFMIDVLQDDLESRLPDAEKLYAATGNTHAIEELLRPSILAQYLQPLGEGRGNKRRLMRAVLADGRRNSLAEFGEIWKNETKQPRKQEEDRASKRRKLDLEKGEYGDYFDDSEDDSLANSVRRSRSTTAPPTAQLSRAPSGSEDDDAADASTSPASIDILGGMKSLHLRQRLLALLTLFCTKNPEAFLDTEDLFDLYTEFLRPLPLPIFQQFVVPAKPWLGPNSQASLIQMLLRPLLSATAPAYNENALTQREFEMHYAPFAAANVTAVDNAKVGLLLEGLLRLLWSSKALEVTAELRRVVKLGIGARQERAAGDARKKGEGRAKIEEEALAVLQASAQRMMVVLDMAG
jgi:hypothetical protein